MYRLAICRDKVFASVMSPVLEVELPRFARYEYFRKRPDAENSNTSGNQGRLVFLHANGVETQSAYLGNDGSERDQAL